MMIMIDNDDDGINNDDTGSNDYNMMSAIIMIMLVM